MELRKQRPPALQLPPDADGPLVTLIDNLEDGGSTKHLSDHTIPAERPQMTDRQAAAAGAPGLWQSNILLSDPRSAELVTCLVNSQQAMQAHQVWRNSLVAKCMELQEK